MDYDHFKYLYLREQEERALDQGATEALRLINVLIDYLKAFLKYTELLVPEVLNESISYKSLDDEQKWQTFLVEIANDLRQEMISMSTVIIEDPKNLPKAVTDKIDELVVLANNIIFIKSRINRIKDIATKTVYKKRYSETIIRLKKCIEILKSKGVEDEILSRINI